MKTYFTTLLNSFYINFDNLLTYLPSGFLKKVDLIFLEINYNIETYLDLDNIDLINYLFFGLYLVFIIFFTLLSYILIYPIIYFLIFDLIYISYVSLKHLKDFIIINKFANRFLYYYKNLFAINLKQFLVGTGIFLFYFLVYINFIIYIEFFNNLKYNFINNKIYNVFSYDFFNNLDFFFKINYMNIFFLLILIYIFLHILFGLFNIFYDYLKDVSFILFFLSFFIFFLLFNLFFLCNNLELYLSLIT